MAGFRWVFLALCMGCKTAEGAPITTDPAPTPTAVVPEAPPPKVTAVYPWKPSATERLDVRFPAPTGFTRVALKEDSFGAFLRTLPLLPKEAKAVDYKGNLLYGDGHHPNVAGIVDIDVGTSDLQQCADAVIRMNAEWKYGRGDRDIAYKTVSGTSIPYRRYMNGDRAIAKGNTIELVHVRGAGDDHARFRSYLDDVFSWASTRSLERDSTKVAFSDLRPGDFFILTGVPFGHTVLILDEAKDDRGRIALLLGQSYMPAQSYQVLRPSEQSTWFVLEPDAKQIVTPFWTPFPIESLHRL